MSFDTIKIFRIKAGWNAAFIILMGKNDIDFLSSLEYNIKCKESKEFQSFFERMTNMEIAKISSKGQITIPVSVRKKLKLKTGDKIVIFEEDGRFYFENSAMLAFKRAEEAFAGEAAKAGFETEEDMRNYMREIRKEVRGY